MVHIAEAIENVCSNIRFQLRISGDLLWRLSYLLLYYSFWFLLRFGPRQKARHHKALLWLKSLGLSDRCVDIRLNGGIMLQVDLYTTHDILRSIYEEKVYEPFLPFVLKAGMVVLDVGGQQGVYTCLAAQRVGPQGQVVAFEPHPGNFKILSGNITRNRLSHAKAVHTAILDHSGAVDLYLHSHSGWHSAVRSSGKGKVRVPCTSLDEAVGTLGVSRVDLIKVDVEGAVLNVLRGAKKVLGRYKPLVVLELDRNIAREKELLFLLESVGYTFQVHSNYLYAQFSAPAGSQTRT